MHEDLLGYLLGALEPDEMQRISDLLREDEDLRRQLAQIEKSLRPLEEGFEAVEPPSADLLSRTLDSIPYGPPPTSDDEADVPEHRVRLASADMVAEPSPQLSRWSAMDSVGSCLAVAVLLALLLPSIAAGRFEARKVACADQFRELGTAFIEYVCRDRQRRLPQLNASGPEAFAGVYAIRLRDAGLMPDPTVRWCPSWDPQPVQLDSSAKMDTVAEPMNLAKTVLLPSASELHDMSVNELQRIQRLAGGSYAYSLGVIADDGYRSPRFESRTSFAVMSDAPVATLVSADGARQLKFSHGGRGMNVLYEDGSVRFVRAEALSTMPDDPLVNHVGASEAGVNIDDASLAPSWRPPFADALQR